MNCLRLKYLTVLLLFVSFLHAQTIFNSQLISGKTKKGISFAHILIKNTQKGTLSDSEGWFKLQCYTNDTIIIKCLGYQTHSFVVADNIMKDAIVLTDDTIKIDEITIHAESVYRMLVRVRDSTYKYFPETLQGICYRHDKLTRNNKTERDVNAEILFKTERRNRGYNNINYWLKDIKSFNKNSVQKQPHISYENTIPLYGIIINPLLPLSLKINAKKELAKAKYSIIFESDSIIIVKAAIEKPSKRKVTDGIFKINKNKWLLEEAEYIGNFKNNPVAGQGLYHHQTTVKFVYEQLDNIVIMKKFSLKWLFSYEKSEPINLWDYSVAMDITPSKKEIPFQNFEKLTRRNALLYKEE